MRIKKIFTPLALSAALLCGCSGQIIPNSQEETRESSYRQIPQESPAYASLYEDPGLGLKVQYVMGSTGNYVITYGEQSAELTLEYAPEEIQDASVAPWGENSPFLIFHAVSQNGGEQYLILNSEMMSEVEINDPLETAKTFSENSEIPKAQAATVTPVYPLHFFSEDDTFICDVPLQTCEEQKIGNMRLYYEYDGVGMNCINAEFIPAD